MLLTLLTVSNTDDDGTGSLRWAIEQANMDPETDPVQIEFNIAGTGPFTIAPETALPTITHSVILDGYTQQGASPNTEGASDNAVLQIILSGSNYSYADGLALAASSSVIRGLDVVSFYIGIHLLSGASGNLIAGNFVGADVTGTAPQGNSLGIFLQESTGNTIGGTTPDARNLVSANNQNINLSTDSNGNLVEGNFVGLNAAGDGTLSNNGVGIITSGVSGNTIGGTAAGAGNVVAGQSSDGIQLAFTTGTLVQGNLVGTDPTGTVALPNASGIALRNSGANGNTVGGTVTGAGNLISGNIGSGIEVEDANLVQGNFIGTRADGTEPLGNGGSGIVIRGSNSTIGGTVTGAGNLIGGNGGSGITIESGYYGLSGNLVQGNFIGTDGAGDDLGNAGNGVFIYGQFDVYGAANNTIGGNDAGAANVITHNGLNGVVVGRNGTDPSVNNAILSNSIYANAQLGIDLGNDGVTPNQPGSLRGPNHFQNAPVLTGAVDFGAGYGTVVRGTLSAAGASDYVIQLFANPAADPTGYGQGQVYLGQVAVTTDASGNAVFQASFATMDLAGQVLSATATDASGNTSEFSADLPVLAAAPPVAAFDDEYNTDVGTGVTVAAPGVLANDLAANGQPFTARLVSGPSVGKLTLKPDGSFTYTPKAKFVGDVSFTYVGVQGMSSSIAATVTIHVNPKLYMVTNADDSGVGSFRWALERVNLSNSPGAVSIQFNIPGSGPFTIAPTTALPVITHNGVIQGYSQPGARANPNPRSQGDNAVIMIGLSGANLRTPADGLIITDPGSTVQGLQIGGFVNGIHLTANDSIIAGCFIGVDLTGTSPQGNTNAGVWLEGASGSSVGGKTPAARNIISANGTNVVLSDGATDNLIAGNYIGTNAAGDGGFSSYYFNPTGIELRSAPGNTIGGKAAGAGNLIAAGGDGIRIDRPYGGGAAGGTLVEGNLIGTDATGTRPLGNVGVGVTMNSAGSNTIGGTSPGARNIISANGGGISFMNDGSGFNLVQGNFIGTDITGTLPLGNVGDGIRGSDYSSGNTIGGTVAGAGNVISANGYNSYNLGSGIQLNSQIAGANLIQGNKIGTDVSGAIPLGNANDGIYLIDEGSNTIGGTTPEARNIIAANGRDGIETSDVYASDNLIQGNSIGTDATGTIDLGNGRNGVNMGVSRNTIGGTSPAQGNLIAFNHAAGVLVQSGYWGGANQIEILSNAIYANGALGIDLGGDGVSPNGGPTNGPNDGQNYPVVEIAARKANNFKIQLKGTLAGTPNTTFLIQFFANQEPDPSGYGEGQSLILSTTITTDASGSSSFQLAIRSPRSLGSFITSTATDPLGNTSEFSKAVQVVDTQEPMLAQDDAYRVNPDQALQVAAPGVQINDIALNGDIFTSVLVAGPSHGSLTLNDDGTFTYLPDEGYEGLDSFSYRNKQWNKFSNVATVTIDVSEIKLMVTNTDDEGAGSLRWAITQANAAEGSDPVLIDFAIPGTGPFLIAPRSPLPTITHAVVIDGYTQSGATPNTATASDNAVLQIIVSGQNMYGNGLVVATSNSSIRGLNVVSFGIGIQLLPGSSGNLIAGNFIGTDPTGSYAQGNWQGIVLDGSNVNTVGGTTPEARNLVSASGDQNIFMMNGASGNLIEGNFVGINAAGDGTFYTYGNGIILNDSDNNTIGGTTAGAGNIVGGLAIDGIQIGASNGNLVVGNRVGTDPTGTFALGNAQGIALRYGSSNNTIGGTTIGAGNLISGNGVGVAVLDESNGTTIEGNLIGVDATGVAAMGNTNNGVVLNGSNNTVGGLAAGAGNLIANTVAGDGIQVGDFQFGNAILSNSIVNNAGLGINLGNGANNGQSPPQINTASYSAGSTTIEGSLSGQQPDTTYTLQFFANDVPDPSGAGEGQTLLGTASVTTDADGNATFSVSFGTANTTDLYLSATATDPLGDTSAFAQDVVIAAAVATTATDSLPVVNPTMLGLSSRATSTTGFDLGAITDEALEELAVVVPRDNRRARGGLFKQPT